ncbi:hypothetical protein FOZ62_020628, partial [Perkinsus olseni]
MRVIRAAILFHGIHAVAGLQSGIDSNNRKPPPPVPKKTRVYRRENQQSGDPPPKPFLPADFRLPVDLSTPTSEADTASPPSSPVSLNGVQVMNGQSEELMKKLKARKQKLTEQLGEDADEQSAQPTEREQPDERDGRALPLKQGRKPNWDDIEVSAEGVTPAIPSKKSSRSATNQLGLNTITAKPDATKPVPKPRVTKSPPSTPTEDSQSKNPASTVRSRSPSPSGSKSRLPSPGSRARLPTPDELLQSTDPALTEKSRSRSPSPEEPRSPLPGSRPRLPTPEEIRQSKSLQVYESLLQPQGFKCRVFHAFTTPADEKVMYELALKGNDIKLYYNVLEGDNGPMERKIPTTTSLKRSGMPDDLPKSQPSDCKATMREVLKYAWNYASGRFRPKEGGAVNESPVQQEFSWQLELDSNDTWISFGGENSYAMPSSLGSDVLTKFAEKVFPEKGEPLKLPDIPKSLWYLEMEGKDLSTALNRDFTIHQATRPTLTENSRARSPSPGEPKSPLPGSRARLPTPDELLEATSPTRTENSRARSPSPGKPRSPPPGSRPRLPTPDEIQGQSTGLETYETLLQPQGFKCRVFHAFTTATNEKVLYELAFKGEDMKLFYNVLKGDNGPTLLPAEIPTTTSLKRSGMPDDLPKSQPSDCKATMREVLKYAWNYASGRFRPKEGGAVDESPVQQEFSWQLELDSNDTWISFGGENSYAMPSSLGSDVLTKFAEKVFPEKGEPLKLPDMPETLWYLEMEGKDLSMALNRDFTIHRIRLSGMPIRWKGMTAAISELSGIKGAHAQEEPKTSEDIAKNAFGSYLEAICLEGSRSSEGTFNGETMTVWPFGKEIYDRCNKNNIPIPIPAIIFEPGAVRQSRENAFQVSARSRLAKAMEVLELFARRHVRGRNKPGDVSVLGGAGGTSCSAIYKTNETEYRLDFSEIAREFKLDAISAAEWVSTFSTNFVDIPRHT